MVKLQTLRRLRKDIKLWRTMTFVVLKKMVHKRRGIELFPKLSHNLRKGNTAEISKEACTILKQISNVWINGKWIQILWLSAIFTSTGLTYVTKCMSPFTQFWEVNKSVTALCLQIPVALALCKFKGLLWWQADKNFDSSQCLDLCDEQYFLTVQLN